VYNFSSICVAISDCGPESLHLLQFNVKFSPPPLLLLQLECQKYHKFVGIFLPLLARKEEEVCTFLPLPLQWGTSID
jgi:hypothetical protein